MATVITKGYKELLQEANKIAKAIPVELAISFIGNKDYLFIDLRDFRELQRIGKIPGAFSCPRGMLEFWIDPESPYHKEIFSQEEKMKLFEKILIKKHPCYIEVGSIVSPKVLPQMEGSIDFFKTLGGVPVLRRPVSKPKERNASVSPIDEPSPILPALKDLFPMWISPLRNVPEVIIRAEQFILSPDLRLREETAPLLTSKATTSPSIILIFWSLSIRDLTNLGYFFLSVCTRSD